MACFAGVEDFLIWLVVLCAIVAIVPVVLSFVPPSPAFPRLIPALIQIFNILIWAVVVIAVIILVFQLLMCVPWPHFGGGMR
jgi:hypothetical protein